MPHIVGNTIYLRDYRMSDVEAVYRWRANDEIVWWTSVYVWPESLEQARAFVADQVNNTDPANRKFAICRKVDDKYLGHIGYEHLNLRDRNTELGIVIGDPDSLGQGIGSEAVGLFLRVCFEELGLHRVGLRVLSSNPRAVRCYQKCGFREEGAMRDYHFSRGRWHSLLYMSILEDEYHAIYDPQEVPIA